MNKHSILIVFCMFILVSCKHAAIEYNETASDVPLIDGINPLQETVITSIAIPADSTMATLYGNKIAVQHVRTPIEKKYPKGSVLYLVTWQSQPDSVWFGGDIPKLPKSIETIKFTDLHKPLYSYINPEGNVVPHTSQKNEQRMEFILSLKNAPIPAIKR